MERETIRKLTGDMLIKIGISPQLKGFNDVIDIIETINFKNEHNMQVLFKPIMERDGITRKGVYKRIETLFNNVDVGIWKNEIGYETPKSGTAFLFTLAYWIKNEMDKEEI